MGADLTCAFPCSLLCFVLLLAAGVPSDTVFNQMAQVLSMFPYIALLIVFVLATSTTTISLLDLAQVSTLCECAAGLQ